MSPVALITGAGRGLGRALAAEAARRGFRVYAGVRSEAEPFGHDAITPLVLDVTDAAQRQQAAKRVSEEAGSLDLLIHNAGINSSSPVFGPPETQVRFGTLTREALLGVAETNAVAPLLFTQELLPLLAKDGAARVVAVSSWFASIEECGGRDFNFGYSGSKALMNCYFRLAANALRPHGVTAFMVNPGWMRTRMGGERAERDPADSARDILNLAVCPGDELAGRFVDCNGSDHAW
jgi:NAD(P)-dependent dehydrogenase (short-subunit alcohol dehydrogenase family)